MKLIQSESAVYATTNAEYQSYYPRFLVGVTRNGKHGTVEVEATLQFPWFTNEAKEHSRAQLQSMTVREVLGIALEKAIAGNWLDKPE